MLPDWHTQQGPAVGIEWTKQSKHNLSMRFIKVWENFKVLAWDTMQGRCKVFCSLQTLQFTSSLAAATCSSHTILFEG
jgi:hypothetical protein